MKFSIKTTALALGATLAFGVATAPAQQQSATAGSAAQAQEGRGHGKRVHRRGGRHLRGAGMGRFFRQLNLTDEQKEQMRAIALQTKQATRTQREELFRLRESLQPGVEMTAEQQAKFQELRAELRRAKEQSRTQMLAVLTAEQRAQIEQRRQQHEQRRAERRARFSERTQGIK